MPREITDTSIQSRVYRGIAGIAIAVWLLTSIGMHPAYAQQTSAHREQIRLAEQYFADLNAHLYSRAPRLESTCDVTLLERVGHDGVRSGTRLRGRRVGISTEAQRLSFIRSATITRIRGYETPLLS